MTEEAIKNFLYNTFGYSKIEEIVNEKDSKTHFKKALKGTILATFIKPKTAAPSAIPHIFSSFEIDSQIAKGKNYLYKLYDGFELKPELEKRSFFLSSWTAFTGYTGRDVRTLMDKIHAEEFSTLDYRFYIKGRFKGRIMNDDFYLFTEGSSSKAGAKLIVASFNLSDETVKRLNTISSSCNYIIKNLQAP